MNKISQAKGNNKYPDPYDKPELVVALRNFGGFAGFEDWETVKANFERYSTLSKYFLERIEAIEEEAEMTGFDSKKDQIAHRTRQLLEYIVEITDTKTPLIDPQTELKLSMPNLNTPKYKIILPKLAENLKNEISGIETRTVRDRVTLQLLEQYGPDVGILITLMLRYVELRPLESMLLAPNVPHCYFKGEVVEIMHSSNNVIRLGLTKKYKDKKNLLRLVDYAHAPLRILNKNVAMPDLSSTDLSEFILKYPTEFDHLFRVQVIFRNEFVDPASEGKPDFLFFVKNQTTFDHLNFTRGKTVKSEIDFVDKDSIILNLGAPVKICNKNVEISKRKKQEVN